MFMQKRAIDHEGPGQLGVVRIHHQGKPLRRSGCWEAVFHAKPVRTNNAFTKLSGNYDLP